MSVLRTLRLWFTYIVGIFWLSLASLQVIKLIVTKRGKFFYKKDRKIEPECLSDRSLGSHHTIQVKGARLHYVESGPPDGPLMVMLHGFPEFWYSWRHQIREYNTKYRVIAVDLRGYGGSSKPADVQDYTVKLLVGDIEQLIQSLGKGKPCILMGHDWGGALSWALAAHHPQLIKKVVIMNCPHPAAMMKHVQKSWKQFMKSWYMFLVNLPYFPEWFFSTGDLKMLDNALIGRGMGVKPGAITTKDMEAFKYVFNKRSDFTGPMNYIRATIRGLNSGKYGGKKVEEPAVLLLWGTRDGALNNEMAELSRDYARDFRLIWIEGASHWVQQDEPELVNTHISTFLEE